MENFTYKKEENAHVSEIIQKWWVQGDDLMENA